VSQNFFRTWRLPLVSAVAGLLAGIAAGLLVRPVYEAEIKLVPADKNDKDAISGSLGLLGDLSGLVGLNETSAKLKNEAIEVLRSRSFLEAFITEMNLVDLLARDRTFFSGGGRNDESSLSDAYKELVDMVQVREDRRTGVITVSLSWHDPQQAADWINELIARLNAEMRRRAIEVSDRNLTYLKGQIEKSDFVELRQTLFRLMQTEVTRSMLAKVQPEYAVRIIDRASAPPEDEYVWPNFALLGAAGAALGFLAGLVAIVVRNGSRVQKGTS